MVVPMRPYYIQLKHMLMVSSCINQWRSHMQQHGGNEPNKIKKIVNIFCLRQWHQPYLFLFPTPNLLFI
ncbi:hypothetical protein YC2023_086211 [Brassica napus]